MKTTTIKEEGLSKIFQIILPQTELQKAINSRLQEVASSAKIDGFRQGKVPLSIIKTRYGTQVKGEVLEKQVSECIRKLFTEKNIKPAMQPKVNFEGEPMGDKDVKFKVEIEVLPDIKVLKFSKIKLEKLISDVQEVDIEKALDEIATGQKSYDTIKEKRKSKKGDVVLIDFKGKIDGEYFEGGSSENHTLELGSGQMIPGFEDQLIGLSPSKEKEIEVTFPKDYPNKDLSAKKAIFEIKLKNIMKAKKAKVDENLAKNMGFPDLKTLKESVKNQLQANYDKTSRNRIKRDLLDVLSKQYNFEVPKTMVENENKIIWDRFEQDKKSGLIDDQDKGKKESELKKEYLEIAERRVRLGLLMQEIGNTNKISVNEEEIKKVILQEAKKYPGEENKVLDFYKKNPEALNAIRGPIFEEKVVDLILKESLITEKKVSSGDLFSEPKIEAIKSKKPTKTKVKK